MVGTLWSSERMCVLYYWYRNLRHLQLYKMRGCKESYDPQSGVWKCYPYCWLVKGYRDFSIWMSWKMWLGGPCQTLSSFWAVKFRNQKYQLGDNFLYMAISFFNIVKNLTNLRFLVIRALSYDTYKIGGLLQIVLHDEIKLH